MTLETLYARHEILARYLYDITVVGSTAMRHLALGASPVGLAGAPFPPVVDEPLSLRAADLGSEKNPDGQVYFLPPITGVVGSADSERTAHSRVTPLELAYSWRSSTSASADASPSCAGALGRLSWPWTRSSRRSSRASLALASRPSFSGRHVRHGGKGHNSGRNDRRCAVPNTCPAEATGYEATEEYALEDPAVRLPDIGPGHTSPLVHLAGGGEGPVSPGPVTTCHSVLRSRRVRAYWMN